MKIILWTIVLVSAAALLLYLLTLPGMRSSPPARVEMDGITTLAEAEAACRRTGLDGWDLVAYAQGLVARKFTHYSLRNPWDTPRRAFERGAGYCQQYNLALKELLEHLGIQAQAVYARRVRVSDPDGGERILGHTWLRVEIAGEERDVCAGSRQNAPGVVHFTPLSPVRPLTPVVWLAGHLGSVWTGIVAADEPWTYRER